MFFQEVFIMSNIKNRIDCYIWKKSKLDCKGRLVLPKKLRQKLGLNSNSFILWISAKRKDKRDNEFILEVALKK